MPIKLNWTRGRSLGLALIYLGIMGLIQVLFITIAQYWMQIGSEPIVVLIPIGVAIATFYSLIIIFESSTSMNEYRKTHQFSAKKGAKKGSGKSGILNVLANPYIKPVLIILGIFIVGFALAYLIFFSWVESPICFILADNFGALCVIGYAVYTDKSATKNTR